MKNFFEVISIIAGFVYAILTFLVLIELKGVFFTIVSISIIPVFVLFPIWAYFLWGYSNSLIWSSFLTLIVGSIVNMVYKDE